MNSANGSVRIRWLSGRGEDGVGGKDYYSQGFVNSDSMKPLFRMYMTVSLVEIVLADR